MSQQPHRGSNRAAAQHEISKHTAPLRELLAVAIMLLCLHAVFTAGIRGYVVPTLTPSVHWKYGLQVNSDSQLFQEESLRLLVVMKQVGWSEAGQLAGERLSHTWLIATLYYLTGTQTPYVVYVVDGLIYVLNGLLLFALLYRACGASSRAATFATVLLSSSPLYLFSHSELLREPIAVLGGLLYVVGLLEVGNYRTSPPIRPGCLIAGAVACALGFLIMATLRSYLLIPLLFPIACMLLLLIIWPTFVHGAKVRAGQATTLTLLFACLCLFYVSPRLERVQKYSESSMGPSTRPPASSGVSEAESSMGPSTGPPASSAVSEAESSMGPSTEPPASSAVSEAWKESFIQGANSPTIERAALLAPHSCTVAWQPSNLLPRPIDAKLEALSCAREDFLRFCDQGLLGMHADRSCDEHTLTSAGSVLTHTPTAISFGLFAPFPRMWTDDFGSNGTGIRRVGYIIDGLMAYVLLAGVLYLVFTARQRPDLAIVAVALVGLMTLFALAIPSQFILARIRISVYVPLLALGAAGWLSMLQMKRPT